MLLDGPYSSIVGTGNDEIRDRSSFETGRIFNATLLLWIESGFDPLDFLKLPLLRLRTTVIISLQRLVYGNHRSLQWK
jgi:hypothetical protein